MKLQLILEEQTNIDKLFDIFEKSENIEEIAKLINKTFQSVDHVVSEIAKEFGWHIIKIKKLLRLI